MRARRHLFGPLASRRLGRSLGIDLTPGKVCSFDCVYCQLGRTRNRTLVRRAWVPLREVLAELDDWFERDGRADFVTLSGSGEPTLHPGFGDVIRHAGTASVVPVALLTNGSLLWDPEVRRGAAAADLVKVTFSSWDQSSYERIHRADPGLRFEEVLEGQRRFRGEFEGELRLEVFLVPGINDGDEQVRRIAELARTLNPDRIDLNTAVRPPAELAVRTVPTERMTHLAALFDPLADVPGEAPAETAEEGCSTDDEILALLLRRPCTPEQVAQAFDMNLNEVAKALGRMVRDGRAQARPRGGVLYYEQEGDPSCP